MNSHPGGYGPLTAARAFEPPFTIAVISDTHINPRGSRMLPASVLNLFTRAGAGLIVHLGDVNTMSVLADLGGVAPVIAVVGNNDDDELQDVLPWTDRFTVGAFTFGAIHGHGGTTARAEARATFAGKVDCALFGHSHRPLIETVEGTVFVNPGSATDRRWFEHFGVGLVRVTSERFDPELILYTDPAHLDHMDVRWPSISASGPATS